MDAVLPILIGVGVVILIGVAAYYSWRSEQQRQRALMELARSLGWGFDPSRDRSHALEYADFQCFRKGDRRLAYNTLRGQVEAGGRRLAAKAGDFRYEVTRSNGKTTTTETYRFSYLILHLPFASVPNLLIRPEGVLDKIAGFVGFDDIDFESEEFSRRFFVQSDDKRFAYDVVTPGMMEFLLATQGPAVDLRHGRLCFTDGRSRWTPDQFRGAIGYAVKFLDLWPEHVRRTLGAGAQAP